MMARRVPASVSQLISNYLMYNLYGNILMYHVVSGVEISYVLSLDALETVR